MELRRNRRAAWLHTFATLAPLLLLVYPLLGCQGGGFLSDALVDRVHTSTNTLIVDANGTMGTLDLSYHVTRPAHISIDLLADGGQRYNLRTDEPRSPGEYVAQFDGTYSLGPSKPDRRVVPSGHYRYSLVAIDTAGRQEERQGDFSVEAPPISPPEIQQLIAVPSTISPNGDAVDDEAKISYTLTQDAKVAVFVEDTAGSKSFLQSATQRKPAAYGVDWNGKIGDEILPDGNYVIHVQAQDKIGNVTDAQYPLSIKNGGKSELQITKIEFSPVAVPLGGDLHVTIKVKNTGTTVINTLGPPPGTAYTTNMTYAGWKEDDGDTPRYYERPGVWRVAVSWNVAGSPYPVRWGLTPDLSPLAPGQESTITGTIKVLPRTPEVRFWASVEQGGVGFPGGEVGQTIVRVGY